MISVDFDITGQPLVIYYGFVKYLTKSGNKLRQCFSSKTAFDSFRRKVLYNILSKFGIRMQLVRLVEMHLNGTYSYVWLGKHV
jgi:hypothetical protein